MTGGKGAGPAGGEGMVEEVAPVILARAAPFRLGAVAVDPRTRQIAFAGRSETVEPRVMQVLAVLAAAQGEVVGRNELVARCWDGRIVGDNAIDRVISRIRRLGADFACGAFSVETISKVGYRLRVTAGGADIVADESTGAKGVATAERPHRRLVLAGVGGLALIGLAGATGWTWLGPGETEERKKARELTARADELIRIGSANNVEQAIASLKEATELDPNSAESWGMLALAHRSMLGYADDARTRAALAAAAGRATALDPEQPSAVAALALAKPFYGNWLEVERAFETVLSRRPGFGLIRENYAALLSEVGRMTESADQIIQAAASLSTARAYYRLANSFWSAGRFADAERALDVALERWPRASNIWETKFKILTFTGRADQAIAFLDNPAHRPHGDYLDERGIAQRLAIAQAARSRSPADVDRAIGITAARLRAKPSNFGASMQPIAALGGVDLAFSMSEGHYFGRGPWHFLKDAWPGLSFVSTNFLFNPMTASMRQDRVRFDALLEETGLAAYWRASGKPPDYRAG